MAGMRTLVLLGVLAISSDAPGVQERPGPGFPADEPAKIAQVFFAQHHVQAPDHPYFTLVGDLEALLKVQVCSERGSRSPGVFARLQLGSRTLELPLRGPERLPLPPAGNPLLMKHAYEDSFTALVPGEWIAPGLRVTVELRRPKPAEQAGFPLDRVVFDKLRVGAPTRLLLTMFDVHCLGRTEGDYPAGWFEELGAKLPVAELNLRRVRDIVFDEIVHLPRGGKPATRFGSVKEYERMTGLKFDGEQDLTGKWIGAIKLAAGAGFGGTRRLYYLNIYGVPNNGGEAGGLTGVGNGKMHGILLHELGHALGLPHWSGSKQYPYVGSRHGIPSDSETTPHAGPTWAFDLARRVFLPPTVQEGARSGTPGRYKRDPMAGGGTGDQEKPYLFRHFSDYSVDRMRQTLEKTQVVWDERAGRYASWSPETGSYSSPARGRGGPNCPIEDEVEVISLLATASLVTSEANIVYPPIGPYPAGFLELFEASTPEDRARARKSGYGEASNICLRVTQGGKVRTYLRDFRLDPAADPLSADSLKIFALNLPARNGEVTQVDLLYTPGVMGKGVEKDCEVLHSWTRASKPGHKTQTVTAVYPAGRREPGR